jgi:anti-sigma factor RsiW
MTEHPGTELALYATGEIAAGERARVERHLAGCAACREAVADYRALLAELAATPAVPPAVVAEVAWPRYRAQLRARVEALRAARRPGWRTRWLRPLPLAASTAVAAALALIVYAVLPAGRPADLATMEYDGLAARLPLIDQYRVVEQLDLLEDLDVIRNLDRLASTRGG